MKLYLHQCDGCGDKVESFDNQPPRDWKTYLVQTEDDLAPFKYETCSYCTLGFIKADGPVRIALKAKRFAQPHVEKALQWANSRMFKTKKLGSD